MNRGHERRIRLFAKPDDFFELADVANRCADVAGPLGDLLERACAGDRGVAWLTPLLLTNAFAQSTPAPEKPADEAAKAAQAKGAQPTLQRVIVTGSGQNETEERRRSTASKIIFGRDEIERFGDGTVGEILKRLPGVTTQGRPGRGGAPRMRGLGSGYTQMLIDGEPVPRGFSLDDLSPEQIERIEILRAPTAETGARAIAGTINIITRGGYSRKLNELRLGVGMENGHSQPGASWTRNDSAGNFNYNVSLSANHFERASDSVNHTRTENRDTGALVEQTEHNQASDSRNGVHANGATSAATRWC